MKISIDLLSSWTLLQRSNCSLLCMIYFFPMKTFYDGFLKNDQTRRPIQMTDRKEDLEILFTRFPKANSIGPIANFWFWFSAGNGLKKKRRISPYPYTLGSNQKAGWFSFSIDSLYWVFILLLRRWLSIGFPLAFHPPVQCYLTDPKQKRDLTGSLSCCDVATGCDTLPMRWRPPGGGLIIIRFSLSSPTINFAVNLRQINRRDEMPGMTGIIGNSGKAQ